MTQSLVLIYFFYGLSFFAMGLAALLETGRSPALAEGRSLRFLAAFGIIHGTHEWLESYTLQAESLGSVMPGWLGSFKLLLLISSFVALFIYAYATLRLTTTRYAAHRLYHFGRLALYELLIVLSVGLTYSGTPVDWPVLLDSMARYLLAVPAAALSALSLYIQAQQARRQGRMPLVSPLTLAGFSFALYALAQLFVRPMPAFPAQYINQAVFVSLFGFPIQVVRAIAAMLMTIGLLRAVQILEQERQAQLQVANRARLQALEERDALRRDLLQHTVRSQEDERARIARELHDEIAQLLSALSLQLAAMRSTTRRADMTPMLDQLQSLSRQMSQGLYALVHDLRPPNLDDLGLVPAINSLATQDYAPKGLAVTFRVTGAARRLDPLVETVLFRVAQEALNNVCRHAGVSEAAVDLDYRPGEVCICIADKGAGFDAAENFHPPRGWGLAGMRERVEALSGKLSINTAPGRGTLIQVLIPLQPETAKEVAHGQDHAVARR